jgi:ketosteroid isomerase-like protein
MREEEQTTMNKIDTVKAFSEALDARDFNKAASYLADDFVFAGPVPQPIGKQAFIAVQSAFENAFQGWSFNSHDEVEQGEKVVAAVQITGTHTRDLVLPMPGMPPIPATGKRESNSFKKGRKKGSNIGVLPMFFDA